VRVRACVCEYMCMFEFYQQAW